MPLRSLTALGVYILAIAVGLEGCGSNDQATSPEASAPGNDATADQDAAAVDGSPSGADATADQDAASGDARASQEDASTGDVTSSPSDSGDSGAGADAKEDGQPSDGGGPSDASDASDSTTAPPTPPWLLLVNASADFGSMYLCLSTPVVTPNVLPSAFALVLQNGGGALYYQGPAPYDGVDLAALSVSLYGVSPQVAQSATGTLAGGAAGCADLVANSQASLLGTIAAGTLQHGAAYLVVIGGCAANDDAGPSCGAGYDASSSNLALHISRVDNTTAALEAGIGVQFAQASSQWEAVALAQNGGYGGTIGEVYDAGLPVVVGTASLGAGVVPTNAVVTNEFANPNATFMTVALLADRGQSPIGTLWGVPAMQTFTYGINDAGAPNSPAGGFLTSGNWTLVLVGDPSQPVFVDSGYNPFFAHMIGLPNQP
jgi:hypothetical protein